MAHLRLKFGNPATITLSQDGKRKMLSFNAIGLQRSIDQYKVGDKVHVTIDNQKVTASESQRRYLFGVCYPIIEQYTGHTKEELHEWAMREHFGERIIKVGKKEQKVRRSWTSLAKYEGVEMISWLIDFAQTELDCHIPSPEESGYIK